MNRWFGQSPRLLEIAWEIEAGGQSEPLARFNTISLQVVRGYLFAGETGPES